MGKKGGGSEHIKVGKKKALKLARQASKLGKKLQSAPNANGAGVGGSGGLNSGGINSGGITVTKDATN